MAAPRKKEAQQEPESGWDKPVFEVYEDAEDARAVRLAREDAKRNGTTSLAEIKKEFGLTDDLS